MLCVSRFLLIAIFCATVPVQLWRPAVIMASLPATIQASRKRLVAETLLTLPSQWRKYQRNFDQRVAFEMGEYYRQWSRGCRYITRPEKVHINQACESADEIYTEQVLACVLADACTWKLQEVVCCNSSYAVQLRDLSL